MTEATSTHAVKGFGLDMQCHGFQFETGRRYRHNGEIVLNKSGFHGVAGHPLDVFRHHEPAIGRYAHVTFAGEIVQENGTNMVAGGDISIGKEISLADIAHLAVKWVHSRAQWFPASGETCLGAHSGVVASGPNKGAVACGDYGAADAGDEYGGAMTTGWQGAAISDGAHGAAVSSGQGGAARSSGWRALAATTGEYGAALAAGRQGVAATSGEGSASIATARQGVALASGEASAAMAQGSHSAAIATGKGGAATVEREQGTAMACGRDGRARGVDGCALFLVRRGVGGVITHARAAIVGQNGVKPMTFYQLDANGEMREVTEA